MVFTIDVYLALLRVKNFIKLSLEPQGFQLIKEGWVTKGYSLVGKYQKEDVFLTFYYRQEKIDNNEYYHLNCDIYVPTSEPDDVYLYNLELSLKDFNIYLTTETVPESSHSELLKAVQQSFETFLQLNSYMVLPGIVEDEEDGEDE